MLVNGNCRLAVSEPFSKEESDKKGISFLISNKEGNEDRVIIIASEICLTFDWVKAGRAGTVVSHIACAKRIF